MNTREYSSRLKRWKTLLAFVAAWVLFALASPPLPAADPEITIEQVRPKNLGTLALKLQPALAAIRSDAPFSIDLELESTFPELIEGNLDLTFVDDREVRLRLDTGLLAVPSGQKSFRLFLPAMAARQERANFVVNAVFHAPRGPIDLGTHDLVVPLRGQRQFLMAAAGLGDSTIDHFTRHLGLDMFRPADAGRSSLLTLPVALDRQALPVDPIGLYQFDVLVFAGEYFSRLSGRQLELISDWIETGGGVVVVPTGVLTRSHIEFLDRLAGGDGRSPRFVPDEFGRLRSRKPGSKDWMIACRHGYGRALILRALPAFDAGGSLTGVDAAAWKRAVCFLWNVRPAQIAEILKNGNWLLPTPTSEVEPTLPSAKRYQWLNGSGSAKIQGPTGGMAAGKPRVSYHWNYSEYDDRAPLHPQKFTEGDALRALLFPDEVRVVPFRVVATILTLFLLAIAPADYLLLGLVRRRKYTWVLFPALCVVFTITTVWVARHYTGTTDRRGALAIVDIGQKGTPLRTTRIEHIITAGTHPISTEVKHGLFSMTEVQPLGTPKTAFAVTSAPPSPVASGTRSLVTVLPGTPDDDDRIENADPVSMVGTLPSAYTATRLSRQWSPSMDRVTVTSAQEDLPPFPWSELETFPATTEGGRKAIVDRLRRVVPDCEVLFLVGSQSIMDRSTTAINSAGSRLQNWPKVMSALALRSEGRLFSLVSRISPNGAGDLEDLSLLDAAQADSCLLHVAVKRGDDLLVLRRLLRPNRQVNLD